MSKKKPTKRDLQAAETRDKIFSTAFRLITEKGFDNVTIEEIAKESGVAKGLFYHYFRSKDDIVIETYLIIDKSYSEFYQERAPHCTAVERILLTVIFQARHATKLGVDFVRQIYKSQLYAGTEFFISKERPFYTILRDAIRDAQSEGSIRSDISAEKIANLVLTCGRGMLYDWCLHDGDYDLEESMTSQLNMIIQGLQKAP
ncbi:MAG TPA: TetR/AcrR family transcriptional regulator [Syntrophomonadaceae bacterium]|nr:TetR/AcrR family transcriptional regulator [Syntrophomonadaceae bacterium]HQA07617.1 TetR/AcrR family transcriptional regulator [Syntrophomonadaceae bacterium]HQE22998.1 TetR/AcrR family transcriptional regulator [Syntrophomonadaceae bacterium]